MLILGGSGFIGGATAAAALEKSLPVTIALRQPAFDSRGRTVALDLQDESRLAEMFSRVSVIVHAVSYVGRDSELAHQTNAVGTGAIVRAAELAGRPHIIYVSTASVVGPGPHRGIRPRKNDGAPASAVSASRLAAEAIVLEYGGTVVRPNLVYGPGDRWFIPTLMDLVAAEASSEWSGSVSTVHVHDLAQALLGLSLDSDSRWRGRTVYVNSPIPTAMSIIGEETIRLVDLSPANPSRHVPILTAHQTSLVTVDNWFDSEDVWTVADRAPRPHFRLDMEDASWYQTWHRNRRNLS